MPGSLAGGTSPVEGVLKALGCAHLCAAFKREDINTLGSHLLSAFQLRSPCYHVYLITVSQCLSTFIFKSSPLSVLSLSPPPSSFSLSLSLPPPSISSPRLLSKITLPVNRYQMKDYEPYLSK